MAKVVGRRVEGSVTHYNQNRGYGFFVTMNLEHNQDVFFHISELDVNAPQVGWRFEFTIEDGDEGYRAVEGKKIGESGFEESSKPKHGPGVTNDAGEDSPDRYALERQQKKAAADGEDEDDEDNDPFGDGLRGSKNDLL